MTDSRGDPEPASGLQIVRHSLSLLVRNWPQALMASVGPVLIGAGVLVALVWLLDVRLIQIAGAALFLANPTTAGLVPTNVLTGFLAAMALFLVVTAWIAILWHRYVLLEEPLRPVPVLSVGLLLRYLGWWLMIVLLLFLLGIVVAIAVMLISVALVRFAGFSQETVGFLVTLPAVLLFFWVSVRMSLTLPAAAIGKPIGIGDSWAATGRAQGAVLLAMFLSWVIAAALDWAVSWLGTGPIGIAGRVFSGWFGVMLGISILTTLYGHLVEERRID